MAITFSHGIPLLYLLALVSTSASLFINIAMADKALIDSICQRALNPGLCHNVLDSSTGADRATLGKIAVQASLQKAKSTSGLIRSLASSGNDKEEYQTCLDVYDDAIANLNECDALLASQQFEDANIKASAASTDEDTCADAAQHAPANLKVANKEFADYTSIVLSVTNV